MAKDLVDFTEKREFVYEEVTPAEFARRCEQSVDEVFAVLSKDPELCEKATALHTPEYKVKFVLEQALRSCANGHMTRQELDEVRAIYGVEPYETDYEKARKAQAAKLEAKRQKFLVEKPTPAGKRQCSKCGGTGRFVLYFENGVPKSNTGFDCYKCGGKGWL